MAMVIMGGGDTFNALAFGNQHPNTLEFISRGITDSTAVLTEAGRSFFQTAGEYYERVNGSEAMRIARAARRAVSSVWESDEIKVLTDIGQLQWAGSQMRRWVMAEPTVRKMYQKGMLEGYSEVYNDPTPTQRPGEDHYDYRLVMDGVVEHSEDGWEATSYLDELVAGDKELLFEEQLDILETWGNVVSMIRQGGDDPTSRFNASL